MRKIHKSKTINLWHYVVVAWIVFFFALAQTAPAYPHSWYPPRCCSDKDCAPVTKIEPVGNPITPKGLWLTTKFGRAYMDFALTHMPERLKSQDDKVHACILEQMDSDDDDEYTELGRNIVKVAMPGADLPTKKTLRCVFWPSS